MFLAAVAWLSGGLAHVVGQRAATALPVGDDHLAAQPAQQADGGIVDVGVERALRATRHQRHAHLLLAQRGEDLRVVVAADRRNGLGRHFQHRAQPRIGHEPGGTAARSWPPAAPAGSAPDRAGFSTASSAAPARTGALVGLLDILARVVDKVHVMHARRAGRHAGQAGQAAVDMLDRLFIRRAALFQHVLHQVDAPARAVEFVAQHRVGRASRGAEAAMHAGAQHFVRPLDRRVFQLFGGKGGLHWRLSHQAGVEHPARVELGAQPCAMRGDGAGSGWNTGSAVGRVGPADSVAWPSIGAQRARRSVPGGTQQPRSARRPSPSARARRRA